MGILDVLGSVGSEYGRNVAVNRKLREEVAKQQLEERRQALAERSQQFYESQATGAAKQLRTRLTPIGTPQRMKDGTYAQLVHDANGNISVQKLPADFSPMSPGEEEGADARAKLKAELGRDPTPDELQRFAKVAPPQQKENALETRLAEIDEAEKNHKLTPREAKLARQAALGGAPAMRVEFPDAFRGKGKSSLSSLSPALQKSVKNWADQIMKGDRTIQNVPTALKTPVNDYIASLEEETGAKPKKPLTANEKTLLGVTKQLDSLVNKPYNPSNPAASGLLALIDAYGMQHDNSSLRQEASWLKYKYAHMKPDPKRLHLITAAAALAVIGAAPWVRIGRGKYMYETIVQHLPSPNDSPALMYEKALFLRDQVLQGSYEALGVDPSEESPTQQQAPPATAAPADNSIRFTPGG